MSNGIINKDGKVFYNATGYPIGVKENGKFSLSGLKPGEVINVNTGRGNEKMLVDSIEGNHIFCELDGVEHCVVLTAIGDTLVFRDITD